MRPSQFVAGVFLAILTGCATPRIYPICLYDTDLGASQEAAAAWPSFEERLRAGLALHTQRPEDVVVINSRNAVAKTTAVSDREIRRWWSAVACVGRSGSTTSDAILAICRDYVNAVMANDRAHSSLPDTVVRPACQTVIPNRLVNTRGQP